MSILCQGEFMEWILYSNRLCSNFNKLSHSNITVRYASNIMCTKSYLYLQKYNSYKNITLKKHNINPVNTTETDRSTHQMCYTVYQIKAEISSSKVPHLKSYFLTTVLYAGLVLGHVFMFYRFAYIKFVICYWTVFIYVNVFSIFLV